MNDVDPFDGPSVPAPPRERPAPRAPRSALSIVLGVLVVALFVYALTHRAPERAPTAIPASSR